MNGADIIVLLINPKGDKSKIDKTVNTITAALKSRSLLFVAFQNDWPPHINSFKEVWIIGGDGTLNYFLNNYREILIPIVIFKSGTGNDFAWKLYGSISTEDQIAKCFSATAKLVDAGICNDRIFINGIGIGFDGEVLRSMKTVRELGGHLGYLWIVLKKIFSFTEYFFHIVTGARNFSEKFLLVMVTNGSRTGGGFMVSPKADIADGKLNMVLCKPLPLFKRLRYLPVIEKGKHLGRDFILQEEIEEIKITAPHVVFAHMDGELISAAEFNISILPKKYLFKY